MNTWTTTTYILPDTCQPIVTCHESSVSLHVAGYLLDGHGFVIRLTPAHLHTIKALVEALESLVDTYDNTV